MQGQKEEGDEVVVEVADQGAIVVAAVAEGVVVVVVVEEVVVADGSCKHGKREVHKN